MKDIKETVFVDRYNYKEVAKDLKDKDGNIVKRSLLNEILRKTETFVKFNESYPKYLKMTFEQYNDIRAYNPTLIKEELVDYEKKYYILCMEITL